MFVSYKPENEVEDIFKEPIASQMCDERSFVCVVNQQ